MSARFSRRLGIAFVVSLLFTLISVAPAHAGLAQIYYGSQHGQSFVAPYSQISFGFNIGVLNPTYPVDSLTLTLYAGDGWGGTQLASQTLSPPSGFDGYLDADFGSVSLLLGQMYTVYITTTQSSPYWGLYHPDADWYPQGTAYQFTTQPIVNSYDWDFRIQQSAVPEPGFGILIGVGLGAVTLLGWRWKK